MDLNPVGSPLNLVTRIAVQKTEDGFDQALIFLDGRLEDIELSEIPEVQEKGSRAGHVV